MASNEKDLAEKVAEGKEAVSNPPVEQYVAHERSQAENAEAQERADAMRLRLGVVEQPADPFEAIALFENLEERNPDVALGEGDEAEGLEDAATERADEAADTAEKRAVSAVAENFQNAPEGPSKKELSKPTATTKAGKSKS